MEIILVAAFAQVDGTIEASGGRHVEDVVGHDPANPGTDAAGDDLGIEISKRVGKPNAIALEVDADAGRLTFFDDGAPGDGIKDAEEKIGVDESARDLVDGFAAEFEIERVQAS